VSAVVVHLPEDLRDDLKTPLGTIYTDVEALLEAAGVPVIAVGDVVTAHLENAGHRPDLAVIDERTERSPVNDDVRTAITPPDRTVENPAATITGGMVTAMRSALERDSPTTLLVDGEEDLAALPAVILVPTDGSVVYGQPGEGMVLVSVDLAAKRRARSLLNQFEGEVQALLELLEA